MTSRGDVWMVGLVMLALSATLGVGDTTPLQKFYQDIKETPVLMKLCYRNGTLLESAEAVKVSVYWTGAAYPSGDLASDGKLCYATKSAPQEVKCVDVPTRYDNTTNSGSLVGRNDTFRFCLAEPPYKDKVYVFKIYFTDDESNRNTRFEIYDTDMTCSNALEFYGSLGEKTQMEAMYTPSFPNKQPRRKTNRRAGYKWLKARVSRRFRRKFKNFRKAQQRFVIPKHVLKRKRGVLMLDFEGPK
ncbi:uncharacterized protein LOC135385392 [Ornithodoros turicata]|uniref:uncharacterized protein LOC135385392 n=1 Tax=Ornithodoros turicata TaxID=34597 RepID=UPI00313938BD